LAIFSLPEVIGAAFFQIATRDSPTRHYQVFSSFHSFSPMIFFLFFFSLHEAILLRFSSATDAILAAFPELGHT